MTTDIFDPQRYAIRTEFVNLDGDHYYKATVSELPDVEVYESSAASAYEAIIQCISDLHDAAVIDGRPFPMPTPPVNESYSGRVTLRMGKDLHRNLDLQAKRNGNTLNAEIVSKLSESCAAQELAETVIASIRNEVREMVLSSGSGLGVTMQPADPLALYSRSFSTAVTTVVPSSMLVNALASRAEESYTLVHKQLRPSKRSAPHG